MLPPIRKEACEKDKSARAIQKIGWNARTRNNVPTDDDDTIQSGNTPQSCVENASIDWLTRLICSLIGESNQVLVLKAAGYQK